MHLSFLSLVKLETLIEQIKVSTAKFFEETEEATKSKPLSFKAQKVITFCKGKFGCYLPDVIKLMSIVLDEQLPDISNTKNWKEPVQFALFKVNRIFHVNHEDDHFTSGNLFLIIDADDFEDTVIIDFDGNDYSHNFIEEFDKSFFDRPSEDEITEFVNKLIQSLN